MEEFMLETKRGMKIMNIRKFAWIAFYKNLDCFSENMQFLSMVMAPKLVTYIAPKLKVYKKLMKLITEFLGYNT